MDSAGCAKALATKQLPIKTDLYDIKSSYKNRSFKGYIKKGKQEYKVSINHQQGGMSMFTYKDSPRGFYGTVTPVERSEGSGGFTVESFVLLGDNSGKKMLIEENNRYNKKRLLELSQGDTGLKKIIPLLEAFGLPPVSFPTTS